MLLKVCGITRPEDGILANELGADIIGVVMAPKSPRRGSLEIIKKLSELGFHVASVHTSMEDATKQAGDEEYAQLHFSNGLEDVEKIKESGRKVISVVFGNSAPEMVKELSTQSDLVLLEKKPEISQHMEEFKNIIGPGVGVAGGINATNLEKVMKYRPGFVDVSSSLEISPGIKDDQLMREFFTEVRRIELSCIAHP